MNWFEVDKEGLAALQEGKPKHFIVRELVQNAWDEDITECRVGISRQNGTITAVVSDNNPEGFKDLRDSFTLFKNTPKRADTSKRGRFNLGEKQAIARTVSAKIETTKGTVTFDKRGRHESKSVRERGSLIELSFKGSKNDYDELISVTKGYLPPKNIDYIVNGESVPHQEPLKTIDVVLTTEVNDEGIFRRTQRKTTINIHNPIGIAYLYEMGLPITEIDCKYSIDVQQKVPLSIDRDTVPEAYLKDLYAEVLNAMAPDLKPEESSQAWIRIGSADERVTTEAMKEIVKKRFGGRVVVANPFDKNSVDEAISHGYNVVYGSEMSQEEWANIKRDNLIASSSELFGSSIVDAEALQPDENMRMVAELAKRIARRTLHFDLKVHFIKSQATCGAQFGFDTLTFNVTRLGKDFFSPPISARVIDLIIHELGHRNGNHTESDYHRTLTSIAGELVMIALNEPLFWR